MDFKQISKELIGRSRDEVEEKHLEISNSEEFNLLDNVDNRWLNFNIILDGVNYGKVVFEFQEMQDEEGSTLFLVRNLQLVNKHNKTYLLQEFTSGIKVSYRVFFPGFIYNGFRDELNMGDILSMVELASLFHEFEHAFIKLDIMKQLSFDKLQLLTSIHDGEFKEYKNKADDFIEFIKNEFSTFSNEDLQILLSNFSGQDLENVLQIEIQCSEYAIKRSKDVITFLELPIEKLNEIHHSLGYALYIYEYDLMKFLGKNILDIENSLNK